MKIIVAGGRDYSPSNEAKEWLVKILKEEGATEVVSGMATGADTFGYFVAGDLDLSIKEFPANWEKYGRAAGYFRNKQMTLYADACILFPGGKGTSMMRDLANASGLKVIEYKGK